MTAADVDVLRTRVAQADLRIAELQAWRAQVAQSGLPPAAFATTRGQTLSIQKAVREAQMAARRSRSSSPGPVTFSHPPSGLSTPGSVTARPAPSPSAQRRLRSGGRRARTTILIMAMASSAVGDASVHAVAPRRPPAPLPRRKAGTVRPSERAAVLVLCTEDSHRHIGKRQLSKEEHCAAKGAAMRCRRAVRGRQCLATWRFLGFGFLAGPVA
jgi:hypothetical protein